LTDRPHLQTASAFAEAYTVFASLKLQFTNRVRALSAPVTGGPEDQPQSAKNVGATRDSCFRAVARRPELYVRKTK